MKHIIVDDVPRYFASIFSIRGDIAAEAMDFAHSILSDDEKRHGLPIFSFFQLQIHVNILEYLLHVIVSRM